MKWLVVLVSCSMLLIAPAVAFDRVRKPFTSTPREPASARARIIRAEYERMLRDYTQETYREYLAGIESGKTFLAAYRLDWPRWRENQSGLPGPVFAAYDFYVRTINDRDLGAARVYRVPLFGRTTFAVRVATDGDDGWLEIYDADGRCLGTARTYLELIYWGDQEAIRAGVDRSSELPPQLRDARRRTLWGKPLPG